ncbi:MAG: GntR family transcriptional regulator [Fibrobacteria bacterium]|nr:GntR family transcriptional regulator [Fibrobacteria bacterium]
MATSTSGYLYETVAERIRLAVENGALRAGDRAPSLRTLALDLGVSVATGVQAYRVLEDEGYLEARPQSGHYIRFRPAPAAVPVPEPLAPATEVEVDALVARVFGAVRRPDLLGLGAACAPGSLLPHHALHRHLVAASRHYGPAALAYEMPPGHEPLRRQIVRRSPGWGGRLSARDIAITCGAMEAIHLSLLAVAGPGDVIAVESPTYFGILQAIEKLGMRALEIPVHPDKGISLPALESALKAGKVKAVVASPNFQNPTGAAMDDADKERLVEVLARAGVPLIEDDVYGELAFDGRRPRAAKSFDRLGEVILCSSFSKTLAPGYRMGWVAGGNYQERIARLQGMNTVAAPTLSQMALAGYLESTGYERHLRTLRQTFGSQARRYAQEIQAAFPPGTRVSRPRGGHVLWLQLPGRRSALQLFDQALKKKISIAPGPIFSATGRYRDCVRLNCALPWSDAVADGLRTLGKLAAPLSMDKSSIP